MTEVNQPKKGRYLEDGVTLNIAGRWNSPGELFFMFQK
jgi:hypothetical protein